MPPARSLPAALGAPAEMRTFRVNHAATCVLLGASLVLPGGCADPTDRALSRREEVTRQLAEFVAKEYPGHKAVVVSNPFTQEKGRPANIYRFEEAGIRGLRTGFGTGIRIAAVEFPRLKAETGADPAGRVAPGLRTPLSGLVAETAFDDLARGHPDCRIIVSLIGLPLSITELDVWRREQVFALLNPDFKVLGHPLAVERAFRDGKIAAAVFEAASDDDSAGSSHSVLVTRDNVAEMLKASPGLFGFE